MMNSTKFYATFILSSTNWHHGHILKNMSISSTLSDVQQEEQKALYDNIIEHKKTAILAQYSKDLGRAEGRNEGRNEGRKPIIRQTMWLVVSWNQF